jgi:hypothetical protein
MIIKEITKTTPLEPGEIKPLLTNSSTDWENSKKYIEIGKKSTFLPLLLTDEKFDQTNTQHLAHLGYRTSIMNQIMSECSDALGIMKSAKKSLFRGVKDLEDVHAYKGKSETNRMPVDTPWEVQNMVDNFLEVAGFQARRGNSIFVTSYAKQAIHYGDVFYIFPVNGYRITWNEKISDFYNNIVENNKLRSWLSRAIPSKAIGLSNKKSPLYKKINDYLNKIFWDAKDVNISKMNSDSIRTIQIEVIYLQDMLEKNSQITVKDTKQLLDVSSKISSPAFINQHSASDQAILKNISKNINEFLTVLNQYYLDLEKNPPEKAFGLSPDTAREAATKLGFVDGNLQGALKTKNEIYLHGEYYAVNPSYDWMFEIILKAVL